MQTARGYALKRLYESNPSDARVVGALHKASAQGREFTVINSADFANFGSGDQADNIFERKTGGPKPAKAPNISVAVSGAPMPGPDDFEPDDEKGEFDPSKEGNHNKVRRDPHFKKLYQDAKDPRVWYSKDLGGDRAHGGAHWKQFRRYGNELIHEADVDLTGKVMNKHKSSTGAKIKLNNTIGIK